MINKRLHPVLGLIIFHLAFSSTFTTAAPTDGIHILKFSTFGTISAKTIGNVRQITGTLGQSVAGKNHQSTSYSLDTGFWQGHLLPVLQGDLNDNGQVNLEDVIIGLNCLIGKKSAVIVEADVDGDEKISQAELIYIMRRQAELVD